MAEKNHIPKGPGGGRGRPRPKLENPKATLGRVLKFVGKNYGIHLVLVVICIFVSVLASVQGTMFTKTLIDDYIMPMVKAVQAGGTADFAPLLGAISRVAVYYGCGVLASFIQARLMIYVSQGTLRNLRDEMFQHMQRLPIKYFDTHAHGDIMSRYTNDIDTLRQLVSQSLPQLLNCTITVVSVFISMVVLNIPLTILTLVMVGLVTFISGKFAGLSGRYFVSQQKDLGSLNGFIEEMVEGQKVVKVFCHEEENIEEFTRRNEALYQSAHNANAFSNTGELTKPPRLLPRSQMQGLNRSKAPGK
ncbi:MAG: ABC transporter ATP-binding protein [Ruminiclostridium sp.]|nr:ABC transporter ATP-binding protein [Ruminiclostridium sp.]